MTEGSKVGESGGALSIVYCASGRENQKPAPTNTQTRRHTGTQTQGHRHTEIAVESVVKHVYKGRKTPCMCAVMHCAAGRGLAHARARVHARARGGRVLVKQLEVAGRGLVDGEGDGHALLRRQLLYELHELVRARGVEARGRLV